MNILIIGEFSAFAKHLKNGFEQLGHRVVVTATGDGWKGLKGTGEDIFYEKRVLRVFGKVIPGSAHLFAANTNNSLLKDIYSRFPNGVDLIVVIHYGFLSSNCFEAGVGIGYVRNQIATGAKLIMSICAGDPAGWYAYKEKYKEWGMSASVHKDNRYSFLLQNSDVIIPITYSYYYAISKYAEYENFDIRKIHNAIPLPMTLDNSFNFSSCVGRKIVVFHGIIRPKMKGTYYIQPAMERLQKEFPDKVECVCMGKIPYDEYVKLFDRIDILIDQATNNGWGVNAAIGAMKGKCVLVSCGKENGVNMGFDDVPFVEIKRDTNNIYQVLKELVLNPNRIDEIKKASRRFMEDHCECGVVAKQYLRAVGL